MNAVVEVHEGDLNDDNWVLGVGNEKDRYIDSNPERIRHPTSPDVHSDHKIQPL